MMADSHTALLLLAAGQSNRFGTEDKLLALFKGHPILSYAAGLFSASTKFFRLAVTLEDAPAKLDILEANNWKVVYNPTPENGQGSSIAVGIKYLLGIPGIDRALIILGDMPLVDEAYLNSLLKALGQDDAVISQIQSTLCPPVIFRRSVFASLSSLTDDTGAKSLFKALPQKSVMQMPQKMSLDIDTISDLESLRELVEVRVSG